MTDIDLAAVDLNLLVVLDAVLAERSATRAAARLHVTQSAVSSALRRLRALFDDPLLLRTAHGLVPTARAELIAPRLAAVLASTAALLAKAPASDRAARLFTIACTDAVGVALVPALQRALARRMPSARLRVVTLERELSTQGLASGEVDLLVGIPPALPVGCDGELIYRDPIVCVVRRDHPQVGKRLTLERWAALPHVEVALFGVPDDRVDRALAQRGRTRSIVLSVPHFSSVPFALVGSDNIAVLGRRLAQAYARPFRLRILTPPIALPQLDVQQVWHRRSTHDPALIRFRDLVREVAAE
ncbi:MAG: LysR family transcriptional regulator [Polyangiales bacterium]